LMLDLSKDDVDAIRGEPGKTLTAEDLRRVFKQLRSFELRLQDVREMHEWMEQMRIRLQLEADIEI